MQQMPAILIVTIGHGLCACFYLLAVAGLIILPERGGWETWWLHGPGHYLMTMGLVVGIGGWIVALVNSTITRF